MDLDLIENLSGQVKPDLDWIFFTFIIVQAIVFGILLKLLYSVYFRENEPQDYSLARSLVILTPALTATFWMIQSSLVLSLGLLGTLSFVRFRTPVKRAEDVAFIVVSLAVAVSIAIEALPIAIVLVSCLFIFTFFRNLPLKFIAKKDKTAVITFNTKLDIPSGEVIQALNKIKVKSEFVSARTYDGTTSYVFNASRIANNNRDNISQVLYSLDAESQINIFFPDSRFGT